MTHIVHVFGCFGFASNHLLSYVRKSRKCLVFEPHHWRSERTQTPSQIVNSQSTTALESRYPQLLRLNFLFSGIGFGMIMVSLLVSIYYNMIIAWCLLYMFESFRKDVPWRSCSNDWNTLLCRSAVSLNSLIIRQNWTKKTVRIRKLDSDLQTRS